MLHHLLHGEGAWLSVDFEAEDEFFWLAVHVVGETINSRRHVQDGGVWMLFFPDGPCDHVGDHRFQFVSFVFASHGFAQQVSPFGSCFPVPHHQAPHPEFAGDLKGERLICNFADVHDAVVTQVSPGGGDRRSAQDIVDDFALGTGELIDGIRPRFTVHFHTDDEFIR